MALSAALFVHLLSFAAYLGAGFAQTQFMKASLKQEGAVRDAYEKLAASIVTKIELPAIMGSVASGVVFLVLHPAHLRHGWLHAKLTCVMLLLVLSHVEMFNARKIVKLRAAGGNDADKQIAARKARHGAFGSMGALLVVVVLVLVTFVRFWT